MLFFVQCSNSRCLEFLVCLASPQNVEAKGKQLIHSCLASTTAFTDRGSFQFATTSRCDETALSGVWLTVSASLLPCDLTVKLISINCPRFVACVNRGGPGSTPFALLPCFAVARCVELSAWSGTGLSLDSLQTNCLSLHHDRTLLPTPRMSLAHRFSKKQKQPFAFLHHILSFKKMLLHTRWQKVRQNGTETWWKICKTKLMFSRSSRRAHFPFSTYRAHYGYYRARTCMQYIAGDGAPVIR